MKKCELRRNPWKLRNISPLNCLTLSFSESKDLNRRFQGPRNFGEAKTILRRSWIKARLPNRVVLNMVWDFLHI
jgi:hypothetical protein